MTDAPKTKSCSRVAGKRSLQYYALRHHMEWVLSEKTRDPTTAMKGAWGEDLDVVTMLALKPKPFQDEDDWRRYEASYEIVDLGRSAKTANERLKRLKKMARVESRIKHRASMDRLQEILDAILARQTSLKTKLDENTAKLVASGGRIADVIIWNDWDDLVKLDYEVGCYGELLTLDTATPLLGQMLASALAKLEQRMLDEAPFPNAYDPVGRAVATMRPVGWRKARHQLKEALQSYHNWKEAHDALSARVAEPVISPDAADEAPVEEKPAA